MDTKSVRLYNITKNVGNDLYALQLAKNPSALLSELIELIINLTNLLPESCNYFSKQFPSTTMQSHHSYVINPLTTDDECTRLARLTACCQLAQSISR